MQPDSTFTRRVCAVLLADVTGFSALMGEDDERTARAVQHLHAVIQGIVSEAQGRAEPVAGDALFATFASVVGAVDAAIQIQRRIVAEEFAGQRLQIRIGVHFGDVLLREGAAFGDAINVAARLQTLARPGTICISEGVYRQVRNKFDAQFVDLGRQRLKNISDPVHAYLIVPRETEPVRTAFPWRSAVLWGTGLAALAAVGVLAVRETRRAPAPPPDMPARMGAVVDSVAGANASATVGPAAVEAPDAEPIALGVMVFKSSGGDAENDWRREALRDGLNTQLSGLSRVKVYSKEFIDFLITRKGLTEIEAATQLGIKKMLSGSFVAVAGTLRIETHVVDVASGVMESSYTTTGSEKDFLELQNKLTMGVISRLNLPVTEDEKRTLLAQQNTNVDALKALLEAEGGAPAAPPGPRSDTWPAPAAAYADETGAETAILEVLERYRRATESKELAGLAALYSTFAPEQQAAQQKYFENVRDLRVTIDHVDVAVVGDEAVASYTRTDDFTDARTGRPMHVAVRLTKTLRREDGAWKLMGK